jgi:hypothetical protein
MPVVPPLLSSASRELKRPQPIPVQVRQALILMVYGHPDDPDCRSLTFIEAARETGMKPDVMRRYLDRTEVRALLLRERRAFRAAICAGNEAALQKVRDTAVNGMAVVGAVRALEDLDNPKQPAGVNVNVGIQTNVNGNATIVPGYVIRHRPRETAKVIEAQPEDQEGDG